MNKTTNVSLWIAGQSQASHSNRSFQSLSPEDDGVLADVAQADVNDVADATAAAESAFQTFASLGPSAKEAMLLRAAELLQRDADEFRSLLIDEIGSPRSKADMEIAIATRVLKANAGMARRVTGRTYPSDTPGRWSLGFREPLGVVAGITPFNVPLIKGIKQSSLPLATGNTFVWLSSDQTPLIADRVAKLYAQAGVPPGVFNVIHGFGNEIGDALVSDPNVRAVAFTGSAPVGHHVQLMCGRHRKRVTLELGGKNPLIVLGDADLDAAVQAAVRGGFVYQGQICMASSRVIVDQNLYERFCERFAAAASGLSLGPLNEPATVIGPIINAASRQRIRDHLSDAIAKGANVLCGNEWTGNRLNPTIIAGVTSEMVLYHEESFGPVVTVTAARDRDEAIHLAGDSPGILSAAVFTTDLGSVMEITRALSAGMVHFNDMTIQQEPEVPFGSDGEAGFGREGMQTGIDDYTTWKWVTLRAP